ncbi:MAG TPA: Gfo/Idh/MocA family oxidoreductase [Acidimicrobiales bacterium]|nr:Gfo/Idh/MocA family oxidoreductase [Acidimicrobiales bacterium]
MELRAGLVGLGAMGKNHARVIGTTDHTKLVGIADPLGDPTGTIDKDLIFPSLEELIEQKIDLAVVACPTLEHEQVALKLCEAGVHTLVEKPLAIDTDSALRIAHAFEKANLVGAVGHIERFNPAIRSMRERIADGELGDLYQLSTRRIGPFPNRIHDVGVVKDLATHDLDLAVWVGGAQFKQLSAHTAYKAGRSHEDLVAINGLLENGVVTNHLVNWLSPLKERFTIATGEKGSFIADTLLADLTLYRNAGAPPPWEGISQFRGVSEGDMIRFAIAKPEPLRTEFEGFRDEVLNGQGEIVTMHDGAQAVKHAEAVLQSAETGSTITVGDT